MLHRFELIPFKSYQTPIVISGNLDITAGEMTFDVQLSGNLDSLDWPNRDQCLIREYGLWESTCLELFLGPINGEHYWEFNLAPTGHWNCFSFSDVRQDMQESDSLRLTSFSASKTSDSVQARAEIECIDIDLAEIRIGISAVIAQGNQLSYHALSHRSESPDFHARAHHLLVQ